jgi:rhodanese-related sulfurtransferase
MKLLKITLVFLVLGIFQSYAFSQATTKTTPKTTTTKKKVPMLEVDINAEELKQLKAEYPEIIILDIRTKAEIAQGMIPGAIHVEWGSKEFASKMNTLEKTKPYIVYCESGGRSVNAQRLMKFNDFLNVANLKGGYKEYSKSK